MCVKSSSNFNFVITCHPLSVFTFFNYPSLPHLNHNELKFVTHIFLIFRWVNTNLIYGLCKLGLFWFLKIVPNFSPQKILIQIISNGEIRNNLSFDLFGFTCFDFFCKILKSENENQVSDCMAIGYTVNTYYGYMCNWIMETNAFLEIFSS